MYASTHRRFIVRKLMLVVKRHIQYVLLHFANNIWAHFQKNVTSFIYWTRSFGAGLVLYGSVWKFLYVLFLYALEHNGVRGVEKNRHVRAREIWLSVPVQWQRKLAQMILFYLQYSHCLSGPTLPKVHPETVPNHAMNLKVGRGPACWSPRYRMYVQCLENQTFNDFLPFHY